MNKPKLLLISGIPLSPQNSGGATRLKHTLKYLSQKYEITLKEIATVKKSLWTSLVTGIPYHMTSFYNAEIKEILTSSTYNDIRIEGTQLLYLAKYIRPEVKTKFVELDVSAVSFWRRAWESSNPLVVMVRLFSCLQVYMYERRYLRQYNQVIVMSLTDSQYLAKLYGIKNTQISPNGIDKIEFLPDNGNAVMTFGFIGSASHTPNLAAMKYTVSEILPELKKAGHKYKMIVVGKFDSAIFGDQDIEIIEHIDNLREFYSKIDMLVAPIFSGSGTRIKVLESLSYGRPVVTTQIGAEGIPITSKYLNIGETSWVERIIRIYENRVSLKNELPRLEQQLKPLTWENIFKPEL